MLKPKLPKLQAIKLNKYTGKYLIPLSVKRSIQIDPERFAFYPVTQTGTKPPKIGYNHDTVVNGAYTDNISTHYIGKLEEKHKQVIEDCIALDKYARDYQKYLKGLKHE